MTAATSVVTGTPQEQTRARSPDDEGYVERDGVRVFWERYGDRGPTILFMPTWPLVHFARLRRDETVCVAAVGGSGAGEFASATPATVAAALEEEVRRPVDCRPVEAAGAARAAALMGRGDRVADVPHAPG